METIELAQRYFELAKEEGDDIREHLDTLKDYASIAGHVTELGVRSIISTWAFVMGIPARLVSVDVVYPSFFLHDDGKRLDDLTGICEDLGIDFNFILGDSLKIEIEETDLLFIDTMHTYQQLSTELKLHGNKSRHWIILHDTESCYEYFNNSEGTLEGGLRYAIDEFLVNNPHWFVKEVFTNNNGLFILERKF